MSFLEQEDIFTLIEPMMIKLVEELYPEKRSWPSRSRG